jgi:hypothetical protein
MKLYPYFLEERIIKCKDGKVIERSPWLKYREYQTLNALVDAFNAIKSWSWEYNGFTFKTQYRMRDKL